jgi:hypothetical protein
VLERPSYFQHISDILLESSGDIQLLSTFRDNYVDIEIKKKSRLKTEIGRPSCNIYLDNSKS